MLMIKNKTLKMDENYMKKRYVSLFETGKLSDCSFLVENEKIKSHKIILASSSPVFEAMLYGPLAVSSGIEIDDISVAEFKQMLNFIYTDSVKIVSVYNAWALIYIAKKYLIEDLCHFCLNYVKVNMETSNVLLNYEFADLFNENIMRSVCITNIQMYGKIILNSDYHMKSSTLCYLLDQDEFNINENDLLTATVKWATIECQLQNINISKHNIRAVLVQSGVLSRIRFLSLPFSEINNEIFSEILRDDEIGVLTSCKLNNSPENKSRVQSLNLSIISTPRSNIPMRQQMGLRRVLKCGSIYHASEESKLTTKLMVSKCVLVNGLILPTRRAPESTLSPNYTECLNVTITDASNRKMVHLSSGTNTLMYGTFHTVEISEPLLFEEGKSYYIDVTWSGFLQWSNSEYCLYYFSPSVVKKDVKFEFHDPFDGGFIQGICYYPI